MTIVQGVLKGFSAGEVISSQGTGWVVSEGVLGTRITETGRDLQRGFMQRDFVEIGDKRVRNVVLSTEYNAMLEEAVGEVVAVGFGATSLRSGNRHTVVSMWTPKGGLVRTPFYKAFSGVIVGTLVSWLVALVLAVLAFGIAAIVNAIAGGAAYAVGIALLLIVFAFWVVRPLVRGWRSISDWRTISQHVPR